jgi:hypothetical protein
MKHRGNKNIPDFSRKRPQKPTGLPDPKAKVPPPPPAVPGFKPQATSQKSGRRGA